MSKHLLLATAALFMLSPALAQQTQPSGEAGASQQTQAQAEAGAGMDDAGAAEEFVAAAGMGDLFEIETARLAEEKAESDEVRQFAQDLLADHSQSAEQLAQAAGEDDVTVAILGRLQMELGSTDVSADSEAGGTASGSDMARAPSGSARADAGATGSIGGAAESNGTAAGAGGGTDTAAAGSGQADAAAGAEISGAAAPDGSGAGTAASEAHVDAGRTAMLDPEHQEKIEELRNLSGGEFDRRFIEIQIEAHEQAIRKFENFSGSGEHEALQQHAEQVLPKLREHLERAQTLSEELG